MKSKIVGVISVVLLSVCGFATASPITYDVNLTGGGETITGAITTDGTLGTITLADITEWSFVVTGAPVAFTLSSTDAGARPNGAHVRSQAERGCAFWEREPGADDGVSVAVPQARN